MRCRSFKPEKYSERVRGVGNSSGDETGSDSMKYWEIVAGKLSAAGWTWGYYRAATRHGGRWTVDAHRGDGRRYIVQSDELLTAFLELEAMLL